jgi:hypothetical protein
MGCVDTGWNVVKTNKAALTAALQGLFWLHRNFQVTDVILVFRSGQVTQ